MKVGGPVDDEIPIVRANFIAAMLNELGAGELRYGRGSWRRLRYLTRDGAIEELQKHVVKLRLALELGDRDRVREHAADCANISMKIDECFGGGA
jgi:hypothetical protein